MIVHPHLFAGGAEKAIIFLSQYLRRMGNDVTVATLSIDSSVIGFACQDLSFVVPRKQLVNKNNGTLCSTLPCMLRELLGLGTFIGELWRNFDVCVAGNFPAYWAVSRLCSHMPVVWLCSEVLQPINVTRDSYERNYLFRLLFEVAATVDKFVVQRYVHEIIACSEFCRDMVKQRYGRTAHVAYTGVDYDFFNSRLDVDAVRKKFNLEKNFVLLHVGFMVKRKSQLLSLRAVGKLLNEMPDLKLVFVGGGPYKPIIKKEAERLGLGENVVFAGTVDEQTLRALYYACDLNLYPSFDQTFGLVPFEALVCGKVSVVSNCAGAARVLKAADAAVIINPSVEEIVRAIRLIRAGAVDLEGMVRRGKYLVKKHFTWEVYGSLVAEILERSFERFVTGRSV
ncbi:MAG: glycosyltransferase family 4 protein [Candidatus Bathyarchaeia archaeon]